MKNYLLIFWTCLSLDIYAQNIFVDITESLDVLEFQASIVYGSGVNAVDIDEDGDIDLYVLTDGESPNQLLINDGAGNFIRVESEISLEMNSRASVFFDYNGDGLVDVFIAGDCLGSSVECTDTDLYRLFEQNPDGSFTNRTNESGLISGSAIDGPIGGLAAGDINNDGFLDLLITEYGKSSIRTGVTKLFENNRDGSFRDVSNSIELEDPHKYWQPLFFDLNKDGWADILLTVDGERNFFFLNKKDGTFEEVGNDVGLNNAHDDMGVMLGDFDNDDDFDIYISNIETEFEGDHNVLLKNNLHEEAWGFTEIAKESGVDKGGWGWGVTFLDYDNDGWLDIAATNGRGTDNLDQSKLWRNTKDDSFEDVSLETGFNDLLIAASLVSFDMDRDGDLDMAQTLKANNPDLLVGIRLLENKSDPTSGNNFLTVKPRMLGNNHWGVNSTVRITTVNGSQTRPITAGISFYGQEPAEAHFGLGNASEVEEVSITWPGGQVSTISNVAVNQSITISDQDVLHTPGGLKGTVMGPSSVLLEWGHMRTFETAFIIERSLDDSFTDIYEVNTTPSQQIFEDQGLNPFSTYYYRVKSTDGNLVSGASNLVSVKTESDVIINQPSDLVGEVLSNTSIILTWTDNSDNEEGFEIQRSLDSSFDQFVSMNLTPNTISFKNNFLEPETNYYFRIRGFRDDGVSTFSDYVRLTTTTVLGSEYSLDASVVIPNPSNGVFFVQPNFQIDGPIEVELINLSGQRIRNWNFPKLQDIENFEFNIKNVVGYHLLYIIGKDKEEVIKLISH